jgi:uncharacterized lipoprotein YddW (UPF0748 family)
MSFLTSHRLWLLVLAGVALLLPTAQAEYTSSKIPVPAPKEQFRGAWIATVWGINWPKNPKAPKEEQQAELRALLDQAVAVRLNAIIFQVRPACDALYESKLEPWSQWLTGTMGKSPGYDPLKFAIAEAHARGLELHAWVNPFRATAGGKSMAKNHVCLTHPEWTRTYGTQKWIDPGEPKARDYSLQVIADIVKRYDIDGLHFDDYFYPYPLRNPDKSIIQFPDEPLFLKYGQGMDRSAWRRANINDFVERLYAMVKRLKPAVKVGISPFGIHQPGVPEGIKAILNPYDQMGCDSRQWLQSGWCDYFTPQLYWRIDPPDQSFSVLTRWWKIQNLFPKHRTTHLWPGLATDRIKGADDPDRPAMEILRQMELTPAGHVHWNLGALVKDQGGIKTLLTNGAYAQPALVPAFPWLGPERPGPPQGAVISSAEGKLSLKWKAADNVRWWIIQQRTEEGWMVLAVLPASTLGYQFGKLPKAISLRASNAARVLGPAISWVQQ